MSGHVVSLFNAHAKMWITQRLDSLLEEQDLPSVLEGLQRLRDDINSDEVMSVEEESEDSTPIPLPHEHMATGMDPDTGALVCTCGFVQPRGDNVWMSKETARALIDQTFV